MKDILPQDIDALRREKYGGRKDADMADDLKRLVEGEPLAYVIGHIPFLGLSIALDSRPLIPRPETEWWTEELCKYIGERKMRVLDLCAGSGAIGLAVLRHCKQTQVSFGEITEQHSEQIKRNLERNVLDTSRADVRSGNLFSPFMGERFSIIATNPPYIPDARVLPKSVVAFEPHEALFAGSDGFSVIEQLVKQAPSHLLPGGELWMECDSGNSGIAKEMALVAGFSHAEIRIDPYGRPRLLVAYL